MKKAIIFVFCLIFACAPLTAAATYNSSIELRSDIALLVNLETGDEIFSVNATKKAAPASLTKVITAVVALEQCKDLSTVVTVPRYCIDMLAGTDSSVAGLVADEQVTMLQLLNCLLVKSANEAALVIADYVGGGRIDVFVAMMNELAQRLGCTNTHFVNVHGLDTEGHYTCAEDMVKFAKYAMTFPVFKETVAKTEYVLAPTNKNSKERTMYTTNFMMLPGYREYYLEQAVGIKTGSTENAGKCFITTASKNGYSYMAVAMGSEYVDYDKDGALENFSFIDCKTMLKWAFDNIRLRVVAESDHIVSVINVNYARGIDHVRLVPKEDYSALVPAGVDADSVLIDCAGLPDSIDAPVKKGDVVGTAEVLYAGESIGNVELVAAEDISRSLLLYITKNIGRASSTTAFKVIIALLVLTIMFFVGANIYVNNKRRRKKVTVVHNIDMRKK